MAVPFIDLYRVHESLQEAFSAALVDLVGRSAFVNGPEVAQFEAEFARWVGARYCVGVSSGMDAEVIALRALGIRPGDRVILPAMTFLATAEAVRCAGGVLVPVDVDDSGLMDLRQAESELKKGACFLLPVHLYGRMVDPAGLDDLAKKYGAILVEDACQAHGAFRKERRAGTVGRAAVFSFYPGKNLGALGDGGAICTDDAQVAALAKALREHGQVEKNVHLYEGYTARLDNLQAKFLSLKLKHLEQWNSMRRSAAYQYHQELGSLAAVRLPTEEAEEGHAYHLFVIRTVRRPQLIERFKAAGIGFGLHYPVPIHQMPCYREQPWAGRSFPRAEDYARCGISLPLFPGITEPEIAEVCRVIRETCQ